MTIKVNTIAEYYVTKNLPLMISVKTGPDTAFDSLLSWMISGAISIKFMHSLCSIFPVSEHKFNLIDARIKASGMLILCSRMTKHCCQ